MKKFKSPFYVTPRIAIILVSPNSNLHILHQELKERHNQYFHLFNLTNLNFNQNSIYVPNTSFKWRDIPFSITEAVRILTQIDTYLRFNNANSAIICVQTDECFRYALFVVQCYLDLLRQEKSLSDKDYSVQQFAHIYKNISIKNPPAKIIESIQFENSNQNFVPIFQIFTQGRYNTFQSVYVHQIQSDLTQYYVKKGAPLNKGFGQKYYDQKPQTKYLKRPVVVFGDVKIVFYSYEKLILNQEFVCGFNTKGLAYEQTVVSLQGGDLYEGELPNNKVHITLTNYCKKCVEESTCGECVQVTKKIIARYSESQVQLQKLYRERKGQQIKRLLSL